MTGCARPCATGPVGTAGAPLPAGTAAAVARLGGVRAVTRILQTEVYPLGRGLREQSPLSSRRRERHRNNSNAGDARVVRGSLGDVRGGDAIGVGARVHAGGHVQVGDAVGVRMADTAPATLRVVAIYDRAGGARGRHPRPGGRAAPRRPLHTDTAVFVAGGAPSGRSLSRYAADHPGVRALDRRAYLGTVHASPPTRGVWLVVGLATAFAMLALVNTAAMTTTERRDELATIRLLGGTAGHATRMIVVLEMVPTGRRRARRRSGDRPTMAVTSVPRGLTGVPFSVPLELASRLTAGAALLGLLAAAVSSAPRPPGVPRRGDARQGLTADGAVCERRSPTGRLVALDA